VSGACTSNPACCFFDNEGLGCTGTVGPAVSLMMVNPNTRQTRQACSCVLTQCRCMLRHQCDSYAVAAGGLYLCAGIIKVMTALRQQVRRFSAPERLRDFWLLQGYAWPPGCCSVLSHGKPARKAKEQIVLVCMCPQGLLTNNYEDNREPFRALMSHSLAVMQAQVTTPATHLQVRAVGMHINLQFIECGMLERCSCFCSDQICL
jgi:hypothetical protein